MSREWKLSYLDHYGHRVTDPVYTTEAGFLLGLETARRADVRELQATMPNGAVLNEQQLDATYSRGEM